MIVPKYSPIIVPISIPPFPTKHQGFKVKGEVGWLWNSGSGGFLFPRAVQLESAQLQPKFSITPNPNLNPKPQPKSL